MLTYFKPKNCILNENVRDYFEVSFQENTFNNPFDVKKLNDYMYVYNNVIYDECMIDTNKKIISDDKNTVIDTFYNIDGSTTLYHCQNTILNSIR